MARQQSELPSQWNCCVYSGGSISPCATRTSKAEENKVIRTGSINFISGPLGVVVNSDTPVSTTEFWNLWILVYWRNSTILNAGSVHIQPPREPCVSPARYCHQAGAVTRVFKVHSTILSSQLFCMLGNVIGPVNSMSMGQLLPFIGCKVKVLEHSKDSTIDKAFCSAWVVVLAKALYAGKAGLYPDCPFQEEQKVSPYWWKSSNVIYLHQGACLTLWRMVSGPIVDLWCRQMGH